MVTSGWRTASAAGTSAILMIALGAPAVPVSIGVILAYVWLWWRSTASG